MLLRLYGMSLALSALRFPWLYSFPRMGLTKESIDTEVRPGLGQSVLNTLSKFTCMENNNNSSFIRPFGVNVARELPRLWQYFGDIYLGNSRKL